MRYQKINLWLGGIALVVCSAILLSACKKTFSDPPVYVVPTDIKANTTIRDLKALMNIPGVPVPIDDSVIIEGVVNCDDRSGNYYQQISLQDSTSGILIRLSGSNLFNDYPVGRKLYIKCKDLWLGDYGEMIQLGGGRGIGADSNQVTLLAVNLRDQHIVKGELNQPVDAFHVTSVSQLIARDIGNPTSQVNTLMILDNFEFVDADLSKTYADATASGNRSLVACGSTSKITLRTSNYSSFGNLPVAQGNGTVTGIFTIFGSTKQFTIRDTTDVKLYGVRCDGTIPVPPGKVIFSESFETIANGAELSLSGWQNFAEVGTLKYTGKIFGSVKCAYISAFKATQDPVTSWLITPAIDLAGAGNPRLTFSSADGYDNGAVLKVYASSDYSGSGSPTGATWAELPATISTGHTSGYGPFIPSGVVSLSAYTGKVYIAFKYEGGDPSKTTSYEFDDVKVSKD